MLKPKLLVPKELEESDKIVREYQPVKLGDFATQIFDEIDFEDREEELKRFKKWAKNRAFYRGNQRGFWDARKRTWVSVDIDSLSPSDSAMLVINNQFRPQVKTLSKEFSRSLVRIRSNALSDSQEAIMATRFADALIKYHQPKILTESQRQLEAKYMLLCGNSFRYIYYSKDKKSVPVTIPIKGNKTLPAYEATVCTECGKESESEDIMETRCSDCGGILEDITIEEKELENVTVGTKVENAGDLVCEIVDPVEMKVWAGASCLEESPYIRRKRLVRANYITKTYPFFKLNQKQTFSEIANDQWQFFDTSTRKQGAHSQQGLFEYDQIWLDPSYYTNLMLEEDYTFKVKKGGQWIDYTMEKGTPLIEKFPDGMYICRVGNDILTFYNEEKTKCWIHVPFDLNVDGFWADGLEDSVMNQQIINEYTSLSVENVLYNASPKLVINPQLINPVTVTGRPKDVVLMSDNARKEEPKQAIMQLSGMSLTNEVMMGIESSKRDMREQTGALLAFNGQGDPNIQTATGMSIARDSALALVSTPLAIRAEKDLEMGWKILELTKENWYDNKYKFLLGKYNEIESEAFKKTPLRETVNIYIEPYSWMPQTNFEKLENLGAYLTAFGLPLGFLNPQIPDMVRQYASQIYNIPFDFDELAPDRRIAQKRLDIAKEIAQRQIPIATVSAQKLLMEGKQEESMALLMELRTTISDAMGVEEDIDEHLVFIDVYKKWLKTDEGQNAHPILREAVKQTMADHKQFQEQTDAINAENMALQNGGVQPQFNGMQGSWQAKTASESPFTPPKAGEVRDFSDNAQFNNN